MQICILAFCVYLCISVCMYLIWTVQCKVLPRFMKYKTWCSLLPAAVFQDELTPRSTSALHHVSHCLLTDLYLSVICCVLTVSTPCYLILIHLLTAPFPAYCEYSQGSAIFTGINQCHTGLGRLRHLTWVTPWASNAVAEPKMYMSSDNTTSFQPEIFSDTIGKKNTSSWFILRWLA